MSDSARSALLSPCAAARASDASVGFASRGSATLDDAAREKIWHEAIARYADEEPLIQLVQYLNTWGLRKGLTHRPRMDERTLAMGVRQAP